jgi:N-methylhydantoinase A
MAALVSVSSVSAPESGRFMLGVDVGGTFTDAVLIDLENREMRRVKVDTTPDDQSRGTLATLAELDLEIEQLSAFCHGTTTGINALLQRKGAKVGLICSEGVRDMLDAGRLKRDNSRGLYDPSWKRPQVEHPIVNRRHIREISARQRFDGSSFIDLDEDEVRTELEFLRDEGIEAVAICLLNAYADLSVEARVVELAHEILPDAYVQSSLVRPVVGEYPRTSAIVLDAYTGPTVSKYLIRLQEGLNDKGYEGPAVIMQMNGGVRTLERTVERYPAYTLESGPVAGMLGAQYFARNFTDVKNLVCVDIGGTSTDIGLVIDGVAQTVDDWEPEWALPLGMPAIDVRSIGAGGGSLIGFDEMGTLHIGPESAGAQPGPASYGRGGERPAITDAHVALGSLRPETFLGGKMKLDAEAATRALAKVAGGLEMSSDELASGAIQLMNASIESEVTKMVFERGADLRDFALFAYGGAGALHAVETARSAGIGEVIVPQMAGGFSALGLATAPAKVSEAISRVEELDKLELAELNGIFGQLEQRAREDLQMQGVAAGEIQLSRSMYGMYSGQSFENELVLGEGEITAALTEDWKQRFHGTYDKKYGYSAPEIPIVLTTLSVTATGPSTDISLPGVEQGEEQPPEDAVTGTHMLHVRGSGPTEATFFRRDRLLAGNKIEGPAVIEDEMTTILIPAGARSSVDEYGSIRIAVS